MRLLVEAPNQYEVSVIGDTVTRCLVDYAFTIQLQESQLMVVIESPFSLTIADADHQIPVDDPQSLGPALAILHKQVKRLIACKDGNLHMEFDGISLRVPPDPAYEAWHISGKDGVALVCMPGGELAAWSESRR